MLGLPGQASAEGLWAVYALWPQDEGPRTIPTNRWHWVETTPGIFAPERAVPPVPKNTALSWTPPEHLNQASAARAALERLQDLPKPQVDAPPLLWCMDWQTSQGQPRLACMEGQNGRP